MTYNVLNILIGILILFSASFVLIGSYSVLYSKYLTKNNNEVKTNRFLSIAVLSLAWIAATFFSVFAVSNAGIFAFSALSLTLIFGFSFVTCEKLLGISGKHKLLYSLTLGIIFNPAWLIIIGVL